MYKTCAINGKAVKRLYIDRKLAYSTEPDQMVLANGQAMADDFGSKVELGSNSYTYNGQTYNYKVYQMPTVPSWSPMGAGNDNPWFATPSIVVCAAHWAGSLKTGTWTGSFGKTYKVSEWINLRTWALANGFTEEDVNKMSDIGDVVVAVLELGSSELGQNECPWFISKDLVKTAFWNGSLRGTIGYHVPQKSINGQDDHDMGLLAPVVMQSNYSWQIPKAGYTAIPSRDSTTKNTAQSYDDTYLAYVGDSGKPTFVKIGQFNVVASQCYSQFAGPDFSACLPVLDAFAKANSQTLNILTEDMLPTQD